MRDADSLGHAAGIVDVLARAAGPLTMRGLAVIVELQSDADDVIALLLEESRHDGGVHAARHRDDDAGLSGGLG